MPGIRHRIPFPCAVYTRKRLAEPYVSNASPARSVFCPWY